MAPGKGKAYRDDEEEDQEDLVFVGMPIEREEDTSIRKRKAFADAGSLRALPVWKQEVRDEEGRRRLHGAFTGGFSAGYFNTVGSKEGWTPQMFTSSRKNKAKVKQESVFTNFLDDDDIKDMGGRALETSVQYDTFGFTSAEYARKQVEKDQKTRPSAIPGPLLDEIILPAASSVGVKLLMQMGWRPGHTIKEAHADSLYESRRKGRKAFLALSGNKGELPGKESTTLDHEELPEASDDIYAHGSTPVYVLQPKQNLYGLGYDPFKHAPEFKDRRRLHHSHGDKSKVDTSRTSNLLNSNSGKYAPGFGIGALEELDIEDEDVYASGFDYEHMEVEVEPTKIPSDQKHNVEERKQGILHGFKVASISDYKIERFHPPVIPDDFVPTHKFSSPLMSAEGFSLLPPREVPPPEDNHLRLLIEGSAAMVARCGRFIEDLYKERSRTNPLFLFLDGGDGHEYYVWKLWEQKQKFPDRLKQNDVRPESLNKKLTVENRGQLLGERPLDRSSKQSNSSASAPVVISVQSNLGDNFTKPSSQFGSQGFGKPFINDPAKQARFEQFLKEKYQGGLRSSNSSGLMSEADRARERLDFEAAAEMIEKWKTDSAPSQISGQLFKDIISAGEQRFVSSTEIKGSELVKPEEKSIFPKREEFQWRPAPVLCKRFDLTDPFMGKPPPLQRPRSKVDAFFMTDFVKSSNTEKAEPCLGDSSNAYQMESQKIETKQTIDEAEVEPSIENLQRPVDLYKAIFSDDSDVEADVTDESHLPDPAKMNHGANMTLNRLVADDFLESLGKELGLEVPPSTSAPPHFTGHSSQAESTEMIIGVLQKNSRTGMENLVTHPVIVHTSRDNVRLGVATEKRASMSYEEHETKEVYGAKDLELEHGKMVSDANTSQSYFTKKLPSPSSDHHQRNLDYYDSSCDEHSQMKRSSHSRRRRNRGRTPGTDSSMERQRAKRKSARRHHGSSMSEGDSSGSDCSHRRSRSSRKTVDEPRSKHEKEHSRRKRRHRR